MNNHNNVEDLTGRRFGRWTVLCRADNQSRKTAWLCRCDCGNTRIVRGQSLKLGVSTSCGCFRNELFSEKYTIHGCAGSNNKINKESRLYTTWQNMLSRCRNKNNIGYKNYGGRGISVTKEWLDFVNFKDWALSNGYTDELEIDRIDVNGNYCPENCRWVYDEIQANNTRRNHFVTFKEETHTVAEWAAIFNISYKVLEARIINGWDIETALTKPVRRRQNSECIRTIPPA